MALIQVGFTREQLAQIATVARIDIATICRAALDAPPEEPVVVEEVAPAAAARTEDAVNLGGRRTSE